jgi:OmpR-family two-component system manganese-sensing sensor histidine kinase
MFKATRRRLTLWYAAVTAVLLLCFATGVYFYVRSTLIDRMDDTLKHVVEVVERSLIVETFPAGAGGDRINVEASFRQNGEVVEADHIDIEWFSPTGHLLWSTFDQPPTLPLQLNRHGQTVHLSPDHLLRQVTKRIERGRQVLGYLRVSHPWFEVTKPIQQLIFDLTMGTLAMIGGVAGIGWLLSGLAMKPIGESYQQLKQFTADASHELRNPIAMIQANVQTALSYGDPQMQHHQLQVVERLTQRLGRLVNDLLFLARSDSGILQPTGQALPLDALLIEVLEEQRLVAAQAGVALSLQISTPNGADCEDETLFAVQGDWDQLARLLTNLISNALAATRSRSPAPQDVTVTLTRRSHQLVIEIADTGIGIPAAALPHLFDRFYRVDPARSREPSSPMTTGTGLGLAIVRAIVDQHQGEITVQSQPDHGTTFTILLPAVTALTLNHPSKNS